MVTLVPGTSQLDVSGEVAGPMMDYHDDDRDNHRATSHQVAAPGGGDPGRAMENLPTNDQRATLLAVLCDCSFLTAQRHEWAPGGG